jgi:predicted molibdopterin-dependent oxidoreductase YjgC
MSEPVQSSAGRFQRLSETRRPEVLFILDGQFATALMGDTILTAILVNASALRDSEFGSERRAGFCLMGACQDCWVWQENGQRVQACSTPIDSGMRLATRCPESWP